MKVGTDGVLLGAWAEVRPDDRRMLDIGTGTGVIALMLAQRSAARITAIDIADVSQAAENIAASPWPERVEAVQCPVQRFAPAEPFDLIVSNPPFYVDALLPPDAGRTLARHTVELSFAELCDAVVRLLAPGGRFAAILPPEEMRRFERTAWGRLYAVRRTEVHSTPKSGVKRVLAEFVRELPAPAVPTNPADPADPTNPADPAVQAASSVPSASSALSGRLVIQEHPQCYTEAYRALTQDFYLKF